MSLPANDGLSGLARRRRRGTCQGVIDCLFEDEEGLVLVDYKTDAITGRFQNGFEGAKPYLSIDIERTSALYKGSRRDFK